MDNPLKTQTADNQLGKILHKIHNYLNPLQIFLDVIDTSKENLELQHFHKTCKESFAELKQFLKNLEAL